MTDKKQMSAPVPPHQAYFLQDKTRDADMTSSDHKKHFVFANKNKKRGPKNQRKNGILRILYINHHSRTSKVKKKNHSIITVHPTVCFYEDVYRTGRPFRVERDGRFQVKNTYIYLYIFCTEFFFSSQHPMY